MDKIEKFLKGFLIGGIIGAVLGMIFAPMPGNETCTRIKQNFSVVRDEVKKAATERSEELKKELETLQKKGETN